MLLYETLSQPIILLCVITAGFLSGFVFDAANALFRLSNRNKIFRHVLDVMAVFVCGFVFFAVILTVNYGDLRVYELLFFVAFLLLQRATIGKLLAKTLKI